MLADALHGQEVRVRPARDGRQRLHGRRLALTTRELGRMIRERGHRPAATCGERTSTTRSARATGSGVIFGATGGVMEAALRTVHRAGHRAQGRGPVQPRRHHCPCAGSRACRLVELPDRPGRAGAGRSWRHLVPSWDCLRGVTLQVAVVPTGPRTPNRVMEDIRAGGVFSECHFIEFMACPGGCLGGGGQPIPTERRDPRRPGAGDLRRGRALRRDRPGPQEPREPRRAAPLRGVPHRRPGRAHRHHLLHTEYTARGTFIDASARSEEWTC